MSEFIIAWVKVVEISLGRQILKPNLWVLWPLYINNYEWMVVYSLIILVVFILVITIMSINVKKKCLDEWMPFGSFAPKIPNKKYVSCFIFDILLYMILLTLYISTYVIYNYVACMMGSNSLITWLLSQVAKHVWCQKRKSITCEN